MHAQVSEEYIHFALMYTADHIFPILPIKNLVNQDGEPTMPHKLVTVTKTLASNLIFYSVHVIRLALAATNHH